MNLIKAIAHNARWKLKINAFIFLIIAMHMIGNELGTLLRWQ